MAAPHTPRGLQPNEPSWQMRVLDQHDTVGGAVLLSPGLLVTCAHVVNAALGLHGDKEEHPGALATVRLKSFDDREWEATVDTQLWSAGPDSRDLAVLRLRDAGPDTSFPVLRECASLDPQQPLYTAGYPEGMRSLQAPLVCQGPGGPTGLTHQVETPTSQPVRITGGFSGCAVRTGTGELVGIMQKTHHYVWNDPDRPSGIAFILPVEELVGERDGGDVVSVQRLADESLCGREAYDSLHDLLDSVSLEVLPPEDLLRPSETRRARRHGTGATAWRVLTALWDLVPPLGEPPPRVAWVHHVHQEIRHQRPLPPAVWSWIRREASPMGRDWEEVLTRDRDRRLLRSREPDAPAAPHTHRSVRPPGTVVTFELEPVTGGYRLLHSIDHRDERVRLPQSTRLVGEAEVCDEIADLMGEATMQMLITPDEDSLRLSVRLPRELLHLSLGQASPHRDLVAFPPLLCTMYEIVYHVRERVTEPHYLGASERWRTRTMRQRARPLVEDRNVLTSWRQEANEVANVLSDLDLTVLVVDDESPDLRHVYDAALYQGVPTIIRGPKSAILPLLQELLDQEPDARVRISGLPRYLRDRARENSDSRKIAIIHDSFEDTLLWNALGGPGDTESP
ncbi:trypsin-like peptidase domain-containing protein [Nocardiopsis deserti]|uniref:trypsin-like peptidase domain-containing protein n=1 Tax=Nocardiopsis deserti TaxID=2605988 RepID=UPI001CC24B66|nr:trypsin-like peptidase domain-containing protein [Nocardiopsis deserti]